MFISPLHEIVHDYAIFSEDHEYDTKNNNNDNIDNW